MCKQIILPRPLAKIYVFPLPPVDFHLSPFHIELVVPCRICERTWPPSTSN